MEWTLAGLFLLSAILLTISLLKSNRIAKEEHKQIDLIHISTMKEINALQESIRNMELDMEVVTKDAGIQLSAEDKVLKREVLDLYRRNYSIESIAEMKQVPENDIEQLLAPFQEVKGEGRAAANEN
ncbi:hypothetical protein BABA_12635 [Neobacillus bataviensis LMG 21833]|uniref:YqzD n=1 Tax=Neobacillus bataviensis LMG 21833 TaxID=1117379 RepID=K6D512_9BACI|nr:hypothetical protein [Neobacillus bataviensis]EKN67577.1 hypothetical protein BABA_12635 [Neobacillus bataviensis LMG 21833]